MVYNIQDYVNLPGGITYSDKIFERALQKMDNKRITKVGVFLLAFLEIFTFGMTWALYYNDCSFRTYMEYGLFSCMFIWIVLFTTFCGMYNAFAIASSSIGESVLSIFISFGISDLILYFISILLARDYVELWPGFICVGCQLIEAMVVVTITKQLLMKKMVPFKTVVIYGKGIQNALQAKEKAENFSKRLSKKYAHLFDITACIDYDDFSDREQVRDIIDQNERVVFSDIAYEGRAEFAKYCIDTKKIFYFVPGIEEMIFMNCETKNLLDTPLKKYDFAHEKMDYRTIKRTFDIILSLVLIIIFCPVMLICAIAIKLEDHGPALFKQRRITRGEKEFTILKFRSMVTDADMHGVQPTTDRDPRITKVGNVLRRFRLDELPQLFNILKGEMSFVGPRPERIEHVEQYEKELPEFKYRHLVKGGLTGYAQVYGKYNTSAEDKLKLDLYYIMNQSLLMDFRLMMLTIKSLFDSESTEGFEEKNREW